MIGVVLLVVIFIRCIGFVAKADVGVTSGLLAVVILIQQGLAKPPAGKIINMRALNN